MKRLTPLLLTTPGLDRHHRGLAPATQDWNRFRPNNPSSPHRSKRHP